MFFFLQKRGFLKLRFLFGYSGSPKLLDQDGFRSFLKVKRYEGFVDTRLNYTNVAITTKNQARASSILKAIESYNRTKLSDDSKIILRRLSDVEELIITCSAKDGESRLEDNAYYKRILEAKKRNDPTYFEWSAPTEEMREREVIRQLHDEINADARIGGSDTVVSSGGTGASLDRRKANDVGSAVEENVDSVGRKRRFDKEDALLDMELEERRSALEERRSALEERRVALEKQRKANALDLVRMGMETMKMIQPDEAVDPRFVVQMQDLVNNIMFQPAGGPSDSGAVQSQEARSIGVSLVVAEMGMKATDAQVQAIGRRTAAKYRGRYGEEPPKHSQRVHGNVILVNSYMEKDRDLMEEAVREVMKGGK